MPDITPRKLRDSIAQRVRRLRQERRWTQAAFAKLLGLSQNRLSEVERGRGSFTAEQLVTILQTFNVALDDFVPPKDAVSELQNALARLGADHLAESEGVLPTERLKEALAVVRETLAVADSPRQIAALAPVFVNHAESLNFAKLRGDLSEVGLSDRLSWAAENTVRALESELERARLSPAVRLRYRRALVALERFLSFDAKRKNALAIVPAGQEDILDPGIASEETLKEVRSKRSDISRAWRIVSAITPEDFRDALEAARGRD